MLKFQTIHQDGYARAGLLQTSHGTVETPVFMPVGTQGCIKWCDMDSLQKIGSQIILANTYHLHLRPGSELIDSFGWIHNFNHSPFPLLTDSGWFQVFSLGQTREGKSLVKINEDGVEFRSHLDGSKHLFNPENVLEIQGRIGADIVMAFDECAPWQSTKEYARQAMERTHRWAKRSKQSWERVQEKRVAQGKYTQALFGIIQGVVYDDLRAESGEYINSLDLPGIAIGWLSVGESKELMYHTLDVLAPIIDVNKPHYLMWVGTPEDLVEWIYRGIDMFDCVLPTRIARHGVAMTSYGNLKISHERYREDHGTIPMKPGEETLISRKYSLAYLRHLFKAWESLAGTLMSLHNLEYLHIITKKARKAIIDGKYEEFRKEFYGGYVF